jgi:hypothetical protein
VPTTCGTPISMIRSVIAMANTPSEKASILLYRYPVHRS